MPTLPKTKLSSMRRTSKPAPNRMDKFIENPLHTQTSMLLSQHNASYDTGTAAQTIAFGRSVSRLRESSLKAPAPATDLEVNDGLPLLGLPTENRFVTDNLGANLPPELPDGKAYVLEPEAFRYGFVEPPKYRLVPDLGKSKESFLQSPAERQQRMIFQKLNQKAQKRIHDDTQKEVSLVNQMQQKFPRGALGAEAPVTDGSMVYAEDIKAIDDKAWKKYNAAESRHRDLLGNLSRVQYSKYDPIQDGSHGVFQGPDKYFQSKCRVEGKDSFRRCETTHDTKSGTNTGRLLNIRNNLTKGRQYDIISGAGFTHDAPTVPESLDPVHVRHSHPSIQSRTGPGTPGAMQSRVGAGNKGSSSICLG